MSMNTYSLHSPLCFIIDAQVAPYLCLAYDKQKNQVPPEIQALLDTGRFHEAAASELSGNSLRTVLNTAGYSSIDMAHEAADELSGFPSLIYLSEVEGEILYLSEDGVTSVRSEEMEDNSICFYDSINVSTPFKAAYGSMQEFINEVKSVFGPLGVFPDDFNWMAHIACVDGAYRC